MSTKYVISCGTCPLAEQLSSNNKPLEHWVCGHPHLKGTGVIRDSLEILKNCPLRAESLSLVLLPEDSSTEQAPQFVS